MSDASFSTPEQKQSQPQQHTGTAKPRLSLMSSRQSGIRLKSEDQPDQRITIISTTPDDYAKIVETNSAEKQSESYQSLATTTPIPTTTPSSAATNTTTTTIHKDLKKVNSSSSNLDRESCRLNGNNVKSSEENKMNISREDLIRLLSMLKSELQSKEIALAAIKCEQLKRLINPIEISRSSLASTYIELQDRFKKFDQNNNNRQAEIQPPLSASNEDQHMKGQSELLGNKIQSKPRSQDDDERDGLNILNTLLELLDRHPLLALPRDSIYCLDYNCNELSTKNYLNLKIQHLDNLINQHRRYRYYMNERLKRSEQHCLELTRELELERNIKIQNENMLSKTSGRAILLKHIDQLKENLLKEKKDKETIVMTLLNELLDERERANTLERKLTDHQSLEAKNLNKENTSEKEKSIILEVEMLNLLNTQLKKQSIFLSKDKTELETKVSLLETENVNLKSKLEQQEKRLASLAKSQNSSAAQTKPQVPAKPAQLLDQQRNPQI